MNKDNQLLIEAVKTENIASLKIRKQYSIRLNKKNPSNVTVIRLESKIGTHSPFIHKSVPPVGNIFFQSPKLMSI